MHTDMTRVNAIWQHPLYQQNLKDLIHLEADRIFWMSQDLLTYLHWNEDLTAPVNLSTALHFSMISVASDSIWMVPRMTKPVYRLLNKFYLILLFLLQKKSRF